MSLNTCLPVFQNAEKLRDFTNFFCMSIFLPIKSVPHYCLIVEREKPNETTEDRWLVLSGVQSGSAICPLSSSEEATACQWSPLREADASTSRASLRELVFPYRGLMALTASKANGETQAAKTDPNPDKIAKTHQWPHTIPNCRLNMLAAAAPPLPPSHPRLAHFHANHV